MSTEAKVLTGIGIVTFGIVVAAAVFLGGKQAPAEQQQVLAEEQVKRLVREDSHRKGPENAKVTIVEFGDFQCPACGAAHPIVDQLLDEYKGKVTFVFRQYPLPMHNHAKPAAYAAEAAGAQNKFFEMYDKLYENQKEWSDSKNPVDEFFVTYAKDLKLDVEKFKNDIEKKTHEKKVQQDIDDANAVNVSATPTFYINGVQQVGGLPYDEFKKKIDELLKAS